MARRTTLTRKQYIQRAARAHSDITTLGGVIALLEGGTIYCSESHATVEQIIRLCNWQSQRLLSMYDEAVEKADSL